MNVTFSPSAGYTVPYGTNPGDSRLAPEAASGHPDSRQLERFLRGELSRPDTLAVVRHLLAGCSRCVGVTRRVWQLGEPMPSRGVRCPAG